jgi:hypothetical protein
MSGGMTNDSNSATARAPGLRDAADFCMFRLAAILQGVLARALQGNASSATALEAGRRARPLAELAWQLVQRSF